jgi:hypothetical protein
VGLNKGTRCNNDKETDMSWSRSRRVAGVIGVLLPFTMGAVSWAQQEAPSAPSRREGQSGAGMMGPGMMDPMMPMMADMSRMMQACTRMMNQMVSQAAGPSQPRSPAPAATPETK